ncbi:30S ribosomal protein S20 [candidate division WOR-1 bacterium RIFOXYB2_FULL_42_35]|uniref:Small ribosomal subunit protein bS20 n=1 Tax=candidate division WOR-1 bacterium RIFOXYC2_FULL_41_25 TaxID=1802586 RepID=A0A1F4TIL4_UNCSA|nr:MAG: 30S ribosomal protein S20 [candidate division WOR-1 bacterium RIFOXYA2_FULL_41_14]OGC21574.1 MAG: 30S ribosomal protein S20 [candidate division WOR-1 bacterium RIFOXYB2_FULL_42_35]OGC32552.1 MAG: 30S ribosomal protein S20 [candidate division WOR-1 bacterium RIFOXYC2_FULL_41_25]OGC42220.1 MAG: 30S ribosomal protein S20 [candidate division WOR-1 bacterium RIFOXYD2_FULL_41_8]
MAFRSKSAKKRVGTSKKRRDRNLQGKNAIKKAVKSVEKAILAKSSEISKLLLEAISVIDKAVQHGIIHKNKAARKKSRLTIKTKEAQG